MNKIKKIGDKEKLAFELAKPSGYAKARLGLTLHPKQKDIIDELFAKEGNKVILRAANGVGKTATIITTSILYALEMLNAQVISTSATYRQITTQLIPNLKGYSNLYPNNWRFLDNAISIDGVDKYVGFSSDQEATAQGYHAKPNQPLLIIVDEGAGVADQIYRAFDRCQPTYLLICGSPLSPEGHFYEIETNPLIHKHFKHHIITQMDCVKSKGYWIDDNEINMLIEKWGGKENPLVLSSVFAEFASNAEGQIISLSQINNCINNPPEHIIGKRKVAIDLAAGGDENVIVLLFGNKLFLRKIWKNKDLMSCAGQIKEELDKLQLEIGLLPSEVVADADGLGLGVIHRLRELGWRINEFHGGSKAIDTINYANKISEAWLTGCQKIAKCEVILPNDNVLKSQLLNRKQKLNSSGKLQIESKKDISGSESPDRADALMMCLANTSSGLLTFVKVPKPKSAPLSLLGNYM